MMEEKQQSYEVNQENDKRIADLVAAIVSLLMAKSELRKMDRISV